MSKDVFLVYLHMYVIEIRKWLNHHIMFRYLRSVEYCVTRPFCNFGSRSRTLSEPDRSCRIWIYSNWRNKTIPLLFEPPSCQTKKILPRIWLVKTKLYYQETAGGLWWRYGCCYVMAALNCWGYGCTGLFEYLRNIQFLRAVLLFRMVLVQHRANQSFPFDLIFGNRQGHKIGLTQTLYIYGRDVC